MAGIKITDLSALSVAESADYLCIVDVSDTSQSPAGTTKKIELGNVVESGEWTPIFSQESDACSNATLVKALYSRVGNIVNCSIKGTVDLDFSSFAQGKIEITFPISTTTPNKIGNLSINQVKQFNGTVNSNTRLIFSSGDTSFVVASVEFCTLFQYEVN